MGIDDTKDVLRIIGPGQTEIVVGLTEDRRQMFFGVQGRSG